MKVKTRSQLAEEYGICRKTLYNWLKKKNIKLTPGQLTPKDQTIIFQSLGNPNK